MRIERVTASDQKTAFEILVDDEVLLFPYALLTVKPSETHRVTHVFVNPELGNEAFTYILVNGQKDTLHIDEVLEYNKDLNCLPKIMINSNGEVFF
jgi:hypothetical protein